MLLPELISTQQETLMTTTFMGYNHNEIIQDGEIWDMTNLSGREYPLMTQRKKRAFLSLDAEGNDTATLTGIHGRDQLVFTRGSEVWYGFQRVNGVTVDQDTMPKKMVSMGAYVCIFPDKKYINTADLTDCGSMETDNTADGTLVSMTMCRLNGTDYDQSEITISNKAPANPTGGMLWLDTSGSEDVLKEWAAITEEWTQVATTYVKISGPGIGMHVSQYDTVTLSGLVAPDNASPNVKKEVQRMNADNIVYQAGEGYIVIAGIIAQSIAELKAGTVRVKAEVPDLDYVCEANNRLWGCKYGMENGVVVNEIRASKLGNFRQWKNFMGLSTDSYTVSVGTDGPFTAAVSQRGYPVFFKQGCIHRISGSTPSSYQMSTTHCRGVQRGSWASAIVMNEAIYYKSIDDVMVYDGSIPQSISIVLGNEKYYNACAGAYDSMYYLCMEDGQERWHTFVFNAKTQLWHREDNMHVMGFGTTSDDLYAVDVDTNRIVSMLGRTEGKGWTKEGELDWEAVFGLFGTDFAAQKYLSRFNIRMYLPIGSWVKMYIEYDGCGIWTPCGEIRGRSTKTFMLPVVPRRCDHLRVKLVGHGECKIYSIARQLEVGGDG